MSSSIRSRWAAVGAAVAVALGAGGGIGLVNATVSSGERPVLITIEPCRITDTRPASQVGPKASPIGPNETYTVPAHGTNGNCTIPNDAAALSTNVTALNATADTFLTFWGAGSRPTAANLNPRAGGPPTPNAVTTPLTPAGAFNIYNKAGNTDIVIDVNGYYVDHDHDDRYAPRVQTDTHLGIGMRLLGANQLGTSNGCAANSSNTQSGFLPITLPVGATVQSVQAMIYDGSGAGYSVSFVQRAAGTGSLGSTILATASGGGEFIKVVTHDITPPVPEVVDSNEAFEVVFNPGTVLNNALCSVQITYEMPTPG